MGTGLTKSSLLKLNKAQGGGECFMCSEPVYRGTGYKTFSVQEAEHRYVHPRCFLTYALPKYIAAGIIEE